MALDLLDTPLRITWDLHVNGQGMPEDLALQVASRLVEAQVFFVTLERHPLRHPALVTICERLLAAGCQVEIVSEGQPDEQARLSELPAAAVVTLDVARFCRGGRLAGDDLRRTINQLAARGAAPVCSLVPTRSNLPLLGPLLALCQGAGVTRFKLPNLRIDGSFRQISLPDMVTPSDLEVLRAQLGDARAFRCGLQLDVHDLFLWEILFPDGGSARSEYGGCQAANSLAHIDLAGTVQPCVSWQQSLGSLAGASFAEIWQSPARHEVRASIARAPEGCSGCSDYPVCFGGCRGLSRELPTPDGRDPMCAGRRP